MENIQEQSYNDSIAPKILVVDDNVHFLNILMAFFKKNGILAMSAENGKEALNIYLACPEQYRLILLDMQMPIMDGYMLANHIRLYESSTQRHIPIIAMSGLADESENPDFDGFLKKPFPLDMLLQIARKFLT